MLAAAGAWALARRLRLGCTASAVAGCAYALSGPLLSAVSLFHHHVGAAWVPWVLWALEGLLQRPSLGAALVLGVVTATQIVAGSGDMCLIAGLLGAARIVWALVRSQPARSRRALAVARYGVLAGLLGLALGALQWLPTAELARRAFRATQDARTSSYWSLHPIALVDLAVPRVVADLPVSATAREALFEGREPLLAVIYLGAVPLALAGLALCVRTRRAALAGAGFVVLVVASLGRHTAFYAALMAIPGFGMLRYPQKYLLGAALCASLVAAWGFEAWGQSWSIADRRRVRVFALCVFALSLAPAAVAVWVQQEPAWLARWLVGDGAALTGASQSIALRLLRTAALLASMSLLLLHRSSRERSTGHATVMLVLLGLGDIVAVGRGINPLAPADLLSHRPDLATRLDPGARIHATGDPSCRMPESASSGRSNTWTTLEGVQDTLRPPVGSRWGLFGSFDGEFTGLGSRWSTALLWANLRVAGTPSALRLQQVAGVDRVLHVGRSVPPGLLPLEVRPSPFSCPLLVLRVPETLPRAYAVRRERQALDPETTVAIVLDPAFDPRREVVLESAPVLVADASSGADEVRLVARTLGTVEVQVRLAAPATLVLLEEFDPGWRVAVDGNRAQLLRANGVFRAVRVGEGSHRVLFSYRPRAVAAGASLALAGLCGTLGLALASRRSRR